jgi:hypothetical protein
METINQYKSLLTKFGHTNFILRYFGTYLEWRRIMINLWVETKDQWESNLKAYKYGLRIGQRSRFIESNELSLYEFLQYVQSEELYALFDLKIELINEFNLQNLIDFLEDVSDIEAVQFNKIIIPKTWYFNENQLLQELVEVLK